MNLIRASYGYILHKPVGDLVPGLLIKGLSNSGTSASSNDPAKHDSGSHAATSGETICSSMGITLEPVFRGNPQCAKRPEEVDEV